MSENVESISLDRGAGTCCTIHVHGATITSWKVEGDELLFLSKNAIFDTATPIRGGIPIVFPHFGPWSGGKPKHGFARVSRWTPGAPPETDCNGNIHLSLHLQSSQETKAIWDHDFALVYDIILKEKELEVSLSVTNTGDLPFEFTTLLHNYIRVGDINAMSISSLEGLSYLDALNEKTLTTETSQLLRIGGPVDRIYLNTPRNHLITDETKCFSVSLTKSASLDNTVVWTPWAQGASKLKDMGGEEYLEFVCVESGKVSDQICLSPNETFVAKQCLTKTPSMNVPM